RRHYLASTWLQRVWWRTRSPVEADSENGRIWGEFDCLFMWTSLSACYKASLRSRHDRPTVGRFLEGYRPTIGQPFIAPFFVIYSFLCLPSSVQKYRYAMRWQHVEQFKFLKNGNHCKRSQWRLQRKGWFGYRKQLEKYQLHQGAVQKAYKAGHGDATGATGEIQIAHGFSIADQLVSSDWIWLKEHEQAYAGQCG